MSLVYTPGCWDLLHVGHVRFLKAASLLGDKLIVGVASDSVIKLDKGQPPIIPEMQRLELVESLRYVHRALIYFEFEFLTQLEIFRPSVLVVGGFWGAEKRHREAEEFMKSIGGTVQKISYHLGISSTEIKNKIKAT